MATTSRTVVQAALDASSVDDAIRLQEMLVENIGHEYFRPVGDKYGNGGLMGAAGSYDEKLIELVTNMQDGVMERLAKLRFGSLKAVPYANPHEAARELTGHLSLNEMAKKVQVLIKDPDSNAKKTKRITVCCRDEGCGMTPGSVPKTIFALGDSPKADVRFLQGAFGAGGAMTYRNAHYVVLVSRRDPALLGGGEQDRICVTIVFWKQLTKVKTAFYLVNRPWEKPGDVSEPWSCPADEFPEFTPGTYLALISYGVEGAHRAHGGDERSFDTILNTRLYRPVMPVYFVNEIARAGRGDNIRGLAHRLEQTSHNLLVGEEALPFHHAGTTYQLPVRYVLFKTPGGPGERRKFVAKDHAVLFTSNGQAHHHWTPRGFRERTRFNKLYDRILVVVETDALPIEVRSNLFTPDRSELVRGDAAIRLEQEMETFLRESAVLQEANTSLIRESYKAGSDQPTAAIARRISQALPLAIKGFGFGPSGPGAGAGGSGGNGPGSAGGGGGSSRSIELHTDPTKVTGPKIVQAEPGRTRSITYKVDVVDSFYDGRGELRVRCGHPDIDESDISVGRGWGGRVRVMIAVPDTAVLGDYSLEIVLDDWMRAAGGIGHRLAHTTTLRVVEQISSSGTGTGKPTSNGQGTGGPTAGGGVALRFTGIAEQEDWGHGTVGAIQDVPAQVLAEMQTDYAELAALGDQLIPTILINQDYTPFKKYLSSRSKELTEVDRPREQYAVGVGVGILALRSYLDSAAAKGDRGPDDALLNAVYAATASATLAVMPAFDEFARAAGLTQS